MKIAVIVPVFNDPRVKRALDSILSQKHAYTLSVFVMDGGSSDRTLRILEEYNGDVNIISKPDDGIFHAVNKGIELALKQSFGIIHYLSSNDFYSDPSVIQNVMNFFTQNPGIDALYGDIKYIDKHERIVRRWVSSNHIPLNWHFGWMPPHPSLFIKSAVYMSHGLFDLRYPVASDYEIMLRFFFKKRIRFGYLNRCLVTMTTGGNSNCLRGIVKGNLEVAKICRENSLPFWFLIPFFKIGRSIFQSKLVFKRHQG